MEKIVNVIKAMDKETFYNSNECKAFYECYENVMKNHKRYDFTKNDIYYITDITDDYGMIVIYHSYSINGLNYVKQLSIDSCISNNDIRMARIIDNTIMISDMSFKNTDENKNMISNVGAMIF